MNWSNGLAKRGWSLLGGLGLVVGLLVSGCSSTPQEKFAPVPGLTPVGTAAATASTPTYDTDVFQPGQPLRITITDLPTPVAPSDDQVKTDGTITLLLNHTFTAAGKTRRQLEQEVHDYYVPNYYRQMTVSIQPREATRFYFVDGEVKAPGRQVYMGPMTVLKAIASAGGLTDFSSRSGIKLIHADGRIETINYKKAISHPEQDLTVYPDDKVFVSRRLFW